MTLLPNFSFNKAVTMNNIADELTESCPSTMNSRTASRLRTPAPGNLDCEQSEEGLERLAFELYRIRTAFQESQKSRVSRIVAFRQVATLHLLFLLFSGYRYGREARADNLTEVAMAQ